MGSALVAGVTGLCLGPGLLVRLVKLGLNTAFAVPFLPPQNLPHHGSLAVLIWSLGAVIWFLAGAATRLLLLTHSQYLLQARITGSACSHRVCLARPPAALMHSKLFTHRLRLTHQERHDRTFSAEADCKWRIWRLRGNVLDVTARSERSESMTSLWQMRSVADAQISTSRAS